jgi:hypothetical protein
MCPSIAESVLARGTRVVPDTKSNTHCTVRSIALATVSGFIF